MNVMGRMLSVLVFLALPVFAQAPRLELRHLDRLAERASESVEVTLGAPQLQFVRKLARLDQSEHRDRLAKFDRVQVRLFEFDQDGEFAAADVEAVRAQLRAPGWERRTHGSDGDGEAFVMQSGGEIVGYAALYADARRLCVIHVTGRMNEEDVAEFNRSDCRGWNRGRRGRR
jgi:hypothetical protein